MTKTAQTIAVPGASLYFEVRGAGPVLLMIPGGPADAGVFEGVASRLADRYRVVAVDPRGNSRSVLDGPAVDQDLAVHADDMAAVLAAVGGGPALVLGSSGGAQIGLALAARHPGKLRGLVAHEPPCVALLPDAEGQRAFMRDVVETYHRDGVAAAWQKFEAGTIGAASPVDRATARAAAVAAATAATTAGDGPVGPLRQTPGELAALLARMAANRDFFFARGVRAISSFVPDVAALRAGPVAIAVGVGADSAGELAHRTGRALAEQLGVAPVIFPGDHVGFTVHAAGFADTLHHTLQAQLR
ncbi:MAG TPA: alpha/beta fold hydrolase [Kofleriaceae bacterium]|nr:alpha/beta fold hydrolase [Kofleriaceae bacterium]